MWHILDFVVYLLLLVDEGVVVVVDLLLVGGRVVHLNYFVGTDGNLERRSHQLPYVVPVKPRILYFFLRPREHRPRGRGSVALQGWSTGSLCTGAPSRTRGRRDWQSPQNSPHAISYSSPLYFFVFKY